MNYQTYAPSKALDTFVKCYWTLDGDSDDGPKRQTIVPDGSMEMIFHYGDLYKQYLDDDTSIIQPRCFVIGQLTRPLEIEPTGATGIFSVRFHPEGFLPFATIPIKEMENKAVSLKELFGEKGEQIEQKILCSTTITDKITFIEEFLLSHLADAKTINHIIRSTIETIFTANGQLSVHNLSDRIQINRRQLERQFSETVGLSPKKLSKNNQATIRTENVTEQGFYESYWTCLRRKVLRSGALYQRL